MNLLLPLGAQYVPDGTLGAKCDFTWILVDADPVGITDWEG